MQLQLNIEFEELLKIVDALPSYRLKQLKDKIERKMRLSADSSLEQLLLNGPVATKKDLARIASNRDAINHWRKDDTA